MGTDSGGLEAEPDTGASRRRCAAESAEELAAIYEHAPLLMLLVDEDRRIRRADRLAAKAAGVDPADLLGRRAGEALRCVNALDDPQGCGFGPACQECTVRRTVLDTLETGRSHRQVEARLTLNTHGNAEELTFLLSTARLRLRGQPHALITLDDVTERKRMDERVRHLASFPEHNPNPVLETGLDGTLLYASPAALALFPDLVDRGHDHPLLQGILGVARQLQEGPVTSTEREVRHGDAVFAQAIHLIAESRTLRLYCREVTERVLAEEERNRLLRETLQQQQTLEAANEQLQAQSEELRAANEELQAQTEELQAQAEELRKALDALRDREAELRLIMDAVPAAVSYVGADGRYRRVNEGHARSFGHDAGDVQGRLVRAVVGEAAWQAALPHVEQALAGEPVVFEQEVPLKNVGNRWVHATYTPDRDEAGRVRGFVAHVMDTTERNRAEEARARLAAILEATPDFVASVDSRGRVLNMNRAGRMLVGLGETEDVQGTEIRRFFTTSSYELLSTEGMAAALRDGMWRSETALLSRDGREIPVSQVLLAHKRPDGGVEFLSTVARDISRRKQLEDELRQAQKMEAIGRLAGGVAHDFNNLLMPIMTYSQLLCDRLDPASREHQWAVGIASAAERAAGLPRQLLAFSRKQIIQPRVIDLGEAVTGIERMLRRVIGEDIILTVISAGGLGGVEADPGQIEQVLLNLAVNARDAMPDGGRLTIETRNATLDDEYTRRLAGVEPGRYVMLAVSDTGCGMDRETMSHIFEPFFTTKEVGRGTGLGLSTVYGIVKQSQGEIRVYSEPGKGTTFRVYLPRADAPAVEPAERAGPSSLPDGSETILLVEDDAAVREVTQTVLHARGYDVLTAENGEDALVAARRHPGPIHLLLTDVVMPGLSGRQLADRLAAERPGIRVLFMSGYTEDAIVRHGVLETGIAFLQKPFAPGVLSRKVREILDERGGP